MELEWAPKFGMIQRTIVSAALKFIKKFNKGFHYNIDYEKPRNDGKYEVPHLAFPVESCMDRVVVTKSGENPPLLGQQIFEHPADIKTRKKGSVKIDWNLEDIYTLVVYSSYCDWVDWQILGLPGIRPFGVTSVTGSQPISLKFYSIPSDNGNPVTSETTCHYVCNQMKISEYEITHRDLVEGGIGKEIIAASKSVTWAEPFETEQVIPTDTMIEDNDDLQLTSPRAIEEIDATDDLAVGVYLNSGDDIVISERSDEEK